MKNSVLLLFLVFIASCGSTKKPADAQAVLKTPCPSAGTCTFELLKGKSLLVKNDDFGRPYYALEDTPGRMVIKYMYTKTKNPAYTDDFYEEQVVFETDEALTELDATTGKLLFGIHCFCRGKAGFYKAPTASITYKNNILLITVPNMVDAQLTHSIEAEFK